ncbi:late control gene D protein (GPD) [Variovorax sp. 54]|uniref:DUF2345 domain-containing protein n=1 Tax=Variovorax sp. 54 TaxID=2035212 RepID=UPI000C1847C9|nr:DUF2345 domain-containing protein [Variovorax sp. 54]PIF76348.1 late control gene D protein (GPD) [Variovorax sp. 54]
MPRTLSVSSAAIPVVLGRPALEPVRLSGHEGLNSLFAYELFLKTPDALGLSGVSSSADFDLDAFIGREISCEIELDGSPPRQINALITDAALWGEEGRHVQYKLTLRPWLHMAISTAKRWLVSAAEGIRGFTHKKGAKLIASEDPVEIQAHRDELILVAHKDVVIKSVEGELHITAKKKVVIIGGGSYSEWSESGIKHGTAGTWQEHAALHAQVGPMSRPVPDVMFPRGDFTGENATQEGGHFLSL